MTDKNTNQLVSNNTEYLDLLQNIGTALNNGRQKAEPGHCRNKLEYRQIYR